jgi:hypothetical protein
VVQLTSRALMHGELLSPRRDRTEELLAKVRERAKQTVWYTGGCTSWYLDAAGVPIVSPLTLAELTEDLAEVDWSDFVVEDRFFAGGAEASSAP